MSKELKKIFVANLPWTVGNQELKQYFSKFGVVDFAEIAFDWSTGFSKGYGFVKFKDPKIADNVVKQKEHILEGGKIYPRHTV